MKKKVKFEYPRIISHLGFGLLVFFIGINHHYSIEKDFNLKLGESKKFDKYEIYFEALNMKQQNNYKAIVGSFKLINIKNNSIDFLNPEIRIYSNPETLTYEAAIKTKITSDLYLTMSNVSRSDYYNIKFQNKPLMIWIWISALIIALGGFVQLTLKKNED
jgi:cytochrome c-type biogenesis protein CcmF